MAFKSSSEPIKNINGNKVNPGTFYDFYSEKYFTNVSGGYIILTKPNILLFLSTLSIVTVIFLNACGVCLGFYTLIYLAKDKSEMVQAFYAMGLMGVSIGFHIVKYNVNHHLDDCSRFIRSGVYHYREAFQDELVKFKEEKIKRIRFIVSFVTNGMYFCAFMNMFIPLVTLLLSGQVPAELEPINPFLPFHIYVPFDTRTVLGYGIAYVANGIIMFTMYACFAAHAQLYISTSLQLTMELQVLNFALGNMEERAVLRLRTGRKGAVSSPDLYGDPVFQKCLYDCLRENILHHHVILRFRDTVTPYISATVTVVLLFFSFLMAAGILIILENSRPQLTLLTDLFGFLPLCWVGQEVLNESTETRQALFGTPWPDCDEDFKVLLKVFMSNTQKPIIIRARAVDIKLCLETFGDMVSVGYKIMNVMR